jgi:hypothetical protein
VPPETIVLLLIGAPSTAFGVYCVANRSFPAWMKGLWLWPLQRITPEVVVAEGWSALVVGLTALAYPFVLLAPTGMQTQLSAVTVGALVAALCLVCVAVWLSRRPEAGRR